MLSLPQVTLVVFTSINLEEHYKALEYSKRGIKWGDVKFITDHRLENINDWCKGVIFDLRHYITTDFCMLIHDDGFVVNPESWNPDWLNYDYIGAPWPMP